MQIKYVQMELNLLNLKASEVFYYLLFKPSVYQLSGKVIIEARCDISYNSYLHPVKT